MIDVLIRSNWQELKTDVGAQWAAFSDMDLDRIDGRLVLLLGAVQRRYRLSPEEAERDVMAWWRGLR